MAQTRIPHYFLYGEVQQDVDEHFLHVETVAERSRLHDWRIRPHAHRDLSQLLFIDSGGGLAHLESDACAFQAPALIRIPSGCTHGFDFDPETDGWVVTISGTLLGRITSDYPTLLTTMAEPASANLKRSDAMVVGLRHLFEQITQEFRGHLPARRAALEQLVARVLVMILRIEAHSAAEAHPRNAAAQLVEHFRLLVEDHYRTTRSVGDYAARLCVSRERLRANCVSVTGTSPLKLIHQRRLLEAKRNLIYTGLSVAQIAYGCGFDDPAYFSRFFSNRTGESPNAFRKRRQYAEPRQ